MNKSFTLNMGSIDAVRYSEGSGYGNAFPANNEPAFDAVIKGYFNERENDEISGSFYVDSVIIDLRDLLMRISTAAGVEITCEVEVDSDSGNVVISFTSGGGGGTE